jgi:hypothetical protein
MTLCNCFCHDMNGGPCHPNQKCKCNGGEGYDDTSEWCNWFWTDRDGVEHPIDEEARLERLRHVAVRHAHVGL